MDSTTPDAAATATHDFSFIALVLNADPVVKGVLIILVLASLACWTVMLDRSWRLARLRRAARRFETQARDGSADREGRGLAGRIVAAGVAAWNDQDPTESRAERRERIERSMRGALAVEIRRLQPGLPLLATIGSTAPFVGLFGTVWGIMNSFASIAKSQDTSLSVVAPGIAEALFATAVGLVAAIPAVVAYNKLNTDIGRVRAAFAAGIAHLGDRFARERDGRGARSAAE